MQVSNVRWELQQNYPVLRCTIDGVDASILAEQKLLLIRYRIVFLGGQFEKTHVVKAPESLKKITRISEFKGFTNDRDFFDKYFLPFINAVRAGTFEPKLIQDQ